MVSFFKKAVSLATAFALTAVMMLTAGIAVKTENVITASAQAEYEDEYGSFLYDLGNRESGNNYKIGGNSYYGRWQLGKLALQEAGLMTSGGAWTSLAASYGVYSISDFLNSEPCQDYAVLACHRKNWYYLKNNGAASYIGSTYQGLTVTMAGLIGAAHLVGAGAVGSMMKSGATKTDAAGVSALSYMKLLGGYDIEKTINGTGYGTQVGGAITSKTSAETTTTTTTTTTVTTTTTAPITFSKEEVEYLFTRGDGNGDTEVNSLDATLILIYYAENLLGYEDSFEKYSKEVIGQAEPTEPQTTTVPGDVTAETTTTTTVETDYTPSSAVLNGEDETESNTDSSQDGTEPTEAPAIDLSADTDDFVSENPSLGDVNNDGFVDSLDATKILIFYAQILLDPESFMSYFEESVD